MSAFNAATHLPPSVNSLERLAAWANGALYKLYKNEKYQESDASPLVPIITAQDGLAADKKEHVIFRLSLVLDDDWRTSTNPFWAEAQDFTTAPIPDEFLP
ncbi:hypothetical protein ACQ4N7_24790 [Nodosilinea sp. AN01ver1]|uniref:hypothetical protein n=1 Tax=Nodosilinea sp. AN01ver1 TaxID=3423362 RepID=UPI003D321A9B